MSNQTIISASDNAIVTYGNTSTKSNCNNLVVKNIYSINSSFQLFPSIQGPTESGSANHERVEFNVHDCIESFTGRRAILDQLHEIMDANRKSSKLTVLSQTRVISGMGGVGKSETARRYIQLYKGSYHHIIWIGAETAVDIQNSFRQLARMLGINLKDTNEDPKAMATVVQEVYNALCTKFTLFVFDNAKRLMDDGSDFGIQSYLPPSIKHGWIPPAILVTSRNRKWHPVNKKCVIELSGLDDEECIELLITQLDIEDMEENQETAKKIKTLCDGLPLVVQQVIAFIKQENETVEVLGEPEFTMEDFISSYEKRKSEFLSMSPDESPAGRSAFVISQLTFDKIASNEKVGPLAMRYLRIMSYLPPDNIPKTLLPHILDDDKNLASIAAALKLLEQYNLIKSLGDIFKIHRMIQEVALVEPKSLCMEEEPSSFSDILIPGLLSRFAGFLEQNSLNANSGYYSLNCAAQLLPRLPKAILYSATCKQFHNKLDELLNNNNMFELMVSVRGTVLETAQSDVERIDKKNDLAISHANSGRYVDAIAMFEEILPLQIQRYGPDHEEVLRVHSNIASVLTNQGKHSEALELYSDIFEIQKRVLGVNHMKTIATQFCLARTLFRQRDYEGALVHLRDLLPLSTSALGPDEKVTLDIELLLASTLRCLFYCEESINVCNGLIPKLENKFGRGHYNVWQVKYSLANSYERAGRSDEACEILREYVVMLPRFFSEHHQTILRAKSLLAFILAKTGKFDEGMSIAQSIQNKVNENLATDLGTFAIFYENLGSMFINAGNLSEAKSAYQQAITGLEEFLPSNDPQVMNFKSLLNSLHEKR